ncbi:MAG: 6-phosphogluconolactonase [Opitutaceae bacterium]|nr:6-phosphogluconolactonase [Opitutaceae bacterium]
MREFVNPYGRVVVDSAEALFARAVRLISTEHSRKRTGSFTVALSGGSTPKEWFRWVAARHAFAPEVLDTAHFTVSDERIVPLDSDDSNFGNVRRLLLEPLKIPASRSHPWPVGLSPLEAAAAYAHTLSALTGPKESYGVCMLGMGEDAHTASFFPGGALFVDDGGVSFAAVDTRQRGWRLTITPTGLRTCGLIIVMALGVDKAQALRRVMVGEEEWSEVPAKVLSTASDRVVWLVDEPAASKL